MKTNRIVVLFALTALFTGFASYSYAKSVTISGTHSSSEIKATCAANGGQYTDGVTVGGYGCMGKGGSVWCDKNGICHGQTYLPLGPSPTIDQLLAPRATTIGQ